MGISHYICAVGKFHTHIPSLSMFFFKFTILLTDYTWINYKYFILDVFFQILKKKKKELINLFSDEKRLKCVWRAANWCRNLNKCGRDLKNSKSIVHFWTRIWTPLPRFASDFLMDSTPLICFFILFQGRNGWTPK